jgi:hypothetical protein
MRPGDRFHVHGFRIIINRRDWPRGLQWLQRLLEHWWPPIPPGSTFALTVNGRPMMKIPIPEGGPLLGAMARAPLVLSPTDEFSCAINFSRPMRMAPVSVMIDGYLVRGLDRIADTIVVGTSPPERP